MLEKNFQFIVSSKAFWYNLHVIVNSADYCDKKCRLRPISCQFHQHHQYLQAAFLYESVLRSFYLLSVWLCNFCERKLAQKLLLYVDEIDYMYN